ncbi:hypothetical protein [Actinosynnema sp. NPDC020468]|uniref:hypothetical protein n=1 Tax=Actinosynnema sp. NPDC020468 TaxID=3154488 RepID=UPI0033BFB7DA
MARWVWPAAAGVVTSATGVAVNLATDLVANAWAWLGVVVLTVLGVAIALRLQRGDDQRPRAGGVHNSVSGTVHGTVIQAGTLGSYHENRSTTVNQSAVAREGGTIHQAGRDVHGKP